MKRLIIAVLILLVFCTACALSGINTGVVQPRSAEIHTEQKTESKNNKKSETNTENKNKDGVEETPGILSGRVIVVDAGHGINSYNKQECIAPDSSETKAAFASGTSGKILSEEQLNLAVSLKLEAALEQLGAEVHMTRTGNKSDMTNIDRAEFANKLNAELSVKIHADGSENSSAHGVSVLVPSAKHVHDNAVVEKSANAGKLILEEFVKSTGAYNRGIVIRNDLTGFNWTKVPIVLVEMGFMTNAEEDRLMSTEDYQNKIVSGIVNGICRYFEQK